MKGTESRLTETEGKTEMEKRHTKRHFPERKREETEIGRNREHRTDNKTEEKLVGLKVGRDRGR